MFSVGLLLLGLAFGLLGAAGPLYAQSFSADNAARQSVGYTQASHSAATDLLVDRSEIDSMPQLVDSLLEAITRLSSYSKPSTTPRVSKVSRAEIERTICQGPCAIKAWYLPQEGIFLDDSLTPETNLVHRSILFHELVHFVQEVNREAASMDDCHRWLHREREAYDLQNQYLARIGDHGSYMLMVSNQSWLTSNRHVCRAWEQPADADSAHTRQVFKESGPAGLRE